MTQFTGYSRKELVEFLSHYEEAITGPAADNVRLLGELPLHQVELELQNRDLIETQQALEEARDRYAELYDFAPVGYLSVVAPSATST